MIPEIERILSADDAARNEVDEAGKEAERIRTRAHRKAAQAITKKKEELAASIHVEEESILGKARLRSQEIEEETSQYIKGLREKKDSILEALVENLLKKVTGR